VFKEKRGDQMKGKRSAIKIFLAFILLFQMVACTSHKSATSNGTTTSGNPIIERTVTETQIGELDIPKGDSLYRAQASPDGKRIACEVESPDGYYLVVDGVPGKSSWMPLQPIANWGYFSPDSQHIVYTIGASQGIVVDGVEKDYEYIDGPYYTGDGKHMVYSAKVDGKLNRLVIDGVEQIVPYDRIAKFAISPDGTQIAYVAEESNNMYVAVVNGVPGIPFYWSGALTFRIIFSPDGKHVAYSTKYYVFLDGILGRGYDLIDGESLIFSSNNSLAFFAMSDGQWHLFVNELQYNAISTNQLDEFPVFNKDGSRIAFYVESELYIGNNKITLKHPITGNDVPTNYHPRNDSVVFSGDGTRVACAFDYFKPGSLDNTKSWERIAVDGDVGAEYPLVGNPAFSPDGKYVAYGTANFVIVDATEGKNYDYIVLPASAGVPFQGSGMFTDNFPQSFHGAPVFDNATQFHYIGIKDNKIFYVTEQIKDNLTTTSTLIQTPVTTWDKTFGGAGFDSGNSVIQSADGGFVITGFAEGSGLRAGEFWLIKTDGNGNKLWDKTFGGAGTSPGNSIIQSADGGFVIIGSIVSYGPNNINGDVWLMKTDSNGNKLWDKTFGGAASDVGYSVIQTTDGGFVIVGDTRSFGAGSGDVWLIKTDGNGNKLWDKTFGGTGTDWGYSVIQTSDGSLVIVGSTAVTDIGPQDIWVIKTTSDGNKLWDKKFGGNYRDIGNSLFPSADGGFVIVGDTKSFGDGGDDVWLIKIDGSGNKVWDKTFGGTYNDVVKSATQSKDGGFMFTGQTGIADSWEDRTDLWLIKVN
jgi:hypothetical protein